MAKLGSSYDHTHTWDGKSKRTSWDHEHDHAASPGNEWTGPGGMADHKHRIPKKLRDQVKGRKLGARN